MKPDFGVVTVSHLPRKWAGLKVPFFPSSGRENVGAVEGEQSVRLSPATARRENPHPFQANPQPPNHKETEDFYEKTKPRRPGPVQRP